MKIAHIINGLSLGGSEQVGIDLAIAQRAAGHASHVVALRDPPVEQKDFSASMKRRLSDSGTPYTEFHARTFRWQLAWLPLQLVGLIRRERFDIVHCHAEPGEFIAVMARKLVAFRVARTIHNVVLWPTYRRLGRFTERGFNDDLVIAVTDDAMRAYEGQRQAFGLPVTPFRETINNGIPIPPVEPRTRAPDNVVRMAFFGRAVPQKGLDILLDAIERLASASLPVRFTLYSDAVDMLEWSTRIARLGDFVQLRAPTPDARSIMKDFDVVVMPSRHEGMGLVAVEAFAVGTCVIASDAPGLREVLPPEWPLLVPPEDAEALAHMIASVVRGTWDLDRLGQVARRHAAGYSIGQASARYLDAYHRYLAAGASRRSRKEKQQ